MMVAVVTTLGEPEPMSHQEVFSLMAAVCWLLKQRAYENMRISWIRKREDQMHIFEWEAILMVPTATGAGQCAPPHAGPEIITTYGLQERRKC